MLSGRAGVSAGAPLISSSLLGGIGSPESFICFKLVKKSGENARVTWLGVCVGESMGKISGVKGRPPFQQLGRLHLSMSQKVSLLVLESSGPAHCWSPGLAQPRGARRWPLRQWRAEEDFWLFVSSPGDQSRVPCMPGMYSTTERHP